METFIDVRIVEATPKTRGDYNILRGWDLPDDEIGEDPGYLVRTTSGHVNWYPEQVFKKNTFPIVGKENKITQKDVDALISEIHVDTLEPNSSGTKITAVTVTLKNGFTISETSACVDPANYDAEIGLVCCMEKIESKIWFLLGFLLCSGVYGFQMDKEAV